MSYIELTLNMKQPVPGANSSTPKEYELSSLDETTYAGNLQITIRNGVVSVSGIESHETNTVYDMSAHIVYHRAIGSIGHLTPVTYIATVDKKTAKFTL